MGRTVGEHCTASSQKVQGAQERARQLSLAADGPDERSPQRSTRRHRPRQGEDAERRRRLRGTGGIADATRVPRRARPAESGGSGVPDGCGQPRWCAGVARGPCFEHAAWDGTRGCARQLATVRYRQDSPAVAAELLTHALAEVGQDTALQACIERDLAWAVIACGDVRDARNHTRAALELMDDRRMPRSTANSRR